MEARRDSGKHCLAGGRGWKDRGQQSLASGSQNQNLGLGDWQARSTAHKAG